jgi:hypothetical protein
MLVRKVEVALSAVMQEDQIEYVNSLAIRDLKAVIKLNIYSNCP